MVGKVEWTRTSSAGWLKSDRSGPLLSMRGRAGKLSAGTFRNVCLLKLLRSFRANCLSYLLNWAFESSLAVIGVVLQWCTWNLFSWTLTSAVFWPGMTQLKGFGTFTRTKSIMGQLAASVIHATHPSRFLYLRGRTLSRHLLLRFFPNF